MKVRFDSEHSGGRKLHGFVILLDTAHTTETKLVVKCCRDVGKLLCANIKIKSYSAVLVGGLFLLGMAVE